MWRTGVFVSKKLSNSFSTGGGGVNFECHVQSTFLALMLTGGRVPFFPCSDVIRVDFQAGHLGYALDDVVVHVQDPQTQMCSKLLCQVKHSCFMTEKDKDFKETIEAAWKDFKNKDVFNSQTDYLALITARLSSTDIDNVVWLINKARKTSDADIFYNDVFTANFSSAKKQEKYSVFEKLLKHANNDISLTKQEIHSFLRCFCVLGYDLDYEESVVLSLINSHISQFNEDARTVFQKIFYFAADANLNARSITYKEFPQDILECLNKKVAVKFPDELKNSENISETIDEKSRVLVFENDISKLRFASLLFLFGEWREKKNSDFDLMSQYFGIPIEDLKNKIRDISIAEPDYLKNRKDWWWIDNRKDFFEKIKKNLFENEIEKFISMSERIFEAKDSYSRNLRKGVAESFAALCNENHLENADADRVKFLCNQLSKKLFSTYDVLTENAFENLSGFFAEAVPDTYLNHLNDFFSKFQERPKLQTKNSNSFFINYTTECVTSLKKLAKIQKYFVRCCNLLVKIETIVGDGSALRALREILLLWRNQTEAPFSLQKEFIKNLFSQNSNIAWNLVMELLPGGNQVSFGITNPKWIPVNDFSDKVSKDEYESKLDFCWQLVVDNIKSDVKRIVSILKRLDYLSEKKISDVCELSLSKINDFTEEEKNFLWSNLTQLLDNEKTRKTAITNCKKIKLTRLEQIVESVSRSNIPVECLHLFNNSIYLEAKDEGFGEWEEQLEIRREKALKDVYEKFGFTGVKDLIRLVTMPYAVGVAFAKIANSSNDLEILPAMLNSVDKNIDQFASGYVCTRFVGDWSQKLPLNTWTIEKKVDFLTKLPFENRSWKIVSEVLDNEEGRYWSKVHLGYVPLDVNALYAVNKFIEVNRPFESLEILYRFHDAKISIDDIDFCKKALKVAVSFQISMNGMGAFYVKETIKYLQSILQGEDIESIEWAFLSLLEFDEKVLPINLDRKLSEDSSFYCEIIQYVYKSTLSQKKKKISAEKSRIAANAYCLLNMWCTIPGMKKDESFDYVAFDKWFKDVKNKCAESGHLDVAVLNVGKVLIYTPPDEQGLWINKSIAQKLDDDENEYLRIGFSEALYNSRGAHIVDPDAKPELALAQKYSEWADSLDLNGFSKFASTLRELSQTYEQEAKQIIEEHNCGRRLYI